MNEQTNRDPKKPFKAKFLHPKNWGLWLVLAVFLPLIYLPVFVQFWIGKQLGLFVFNIGKSRRKVTLVNLKLAFPEKSDDERYQMAREVFINQGIGVFETLCAWFRPQLFSNTGTIEGLEHIFDAQKQGKAILLLGGHYTNLDMGGLICTRVFPVSAMYRPQNNEMLDWFILNGRRNLYRFQIGHKDLRKMSRCINNGEFIWYSPDQDFGLKSGVMAKFFGVPAATITAQKRILAMADDANPPAVIAVHYYRMNEKVNGKPHYKITLTPPLTNYPSNDDVVDAQRVNDLFESLIRKAPTQWMWFHKRYKNKEGGRTHYYD